AWRDCLGASGGPFLFGGFGIVDAFFAPVVMRARTYSLPLDGDCAASAARVTAAPGVAAWMALALAERAFPALEQPSRIGPAGAVSTARPAPPPGRCRALGRGPPGSVSARAAVRCASRAPVR